MAKKHHKQKKTHSRRRRSGVGSVNMQSSLMKVVGVAVGAVGGRMLANSLGAKLDPKIVAGGTIVAGVILPAKLGKGSPLMEGIGAGLIAQGATSLLTNFGVIKGFEDDGMSGVGDLDELSGFDPNGDGMGNTYISGFNPVSGFDPNEDN